MLPSINAEKGLELSDDGVLILQVKVVSTIPKWITVTGSTAALARVHDPVYSLASSDIGLLTA